MSDASILNAPGPRIDAAAGIAVGPRDFGRLHEAARVEPAIDRRVGESAVADPVRTIAGPRGLDALRRRDRQRQATPRRQDASDLPTAVELRGRPRDLVDPARREGVRDVVVGRPAVVLRIVDVGQRHEAIVVGIEVDGLAVGVRVEHREIVRESPLELHEQRVVVERAPGLHLTDRAKGRRERGIGSIDVRVGHPDDRPRLVRVALDQHLRPCDPT